MRRVLVAGAAALLLAVSVRGFAAGGPAGLWQTIDDETGQPKSLVRNQIDQGLLHGRVEEILTEPNGGRDKLCEECEGDRHNRPVVGMTILWDLSDDGDWWQGGRILDPANGREYKARLRLLESGDTLEVRGFIGFSLIGRSQTWHRVD